MEIDVRQQPDGTFLATIRGERRRPHKVGKGTTWQEAVRDLSKQGVAVGDDDDEPEVDLR